MGRKEIPSIVISSHLKSFSFISNGPFQVSAQSGLSTPLFLRMALGGTGELPGLETWSGRSLVLASECVWLVFWAQCCPLQECDLTVAWALLSCLHLLLNSELIVLLWLALGLETLLAASFVPELSLKLLHLGCLKSSSVSHLLAAPASGRCPSQHHQ